LSSFGPPDAISRNIYRAKVTGARPNRRELNRMLGKLAAGAQFLNVIESVFSGMARAIRSTRPERQSIVSGAR